MAIYFQTPADLSIKSFLKQGVLPDMKDHIVLTGLRIKCIIGIFDWERKTKQDVVIDLKFPCNIRKAASNDNITDTMDYKKIAKTTIAFVEKSSYQLIETLAEKLADLLLRQFGLAEIELSVSKPGAVRGSQNVGIHIHRSLSGLHSDTLAFVSLGSNIHPELHLNRALKSIDENYTIEGLSHAYKTSPIGFTKQPFFWNMVVAFNDRGETVIQLMNWINSLEKKEGRVRTKNNLGPRTLDIDLILKGRLVKKQGKPQVPHPDIKKKAFVLYPLLEVSPNLIHPESGKTMIEIAAEFDNKGQNIKKLPQDTFLDFLPKPLIR